jgi:hypothetical protein
MAEAGGESSALAWALNARHSALWGPDNLKERSRLSARAVALAERFSTAEDTLLHRAVLMTDLTERGAIHQVDDQVQRFERSAAALAQPQAMWLAPMLAAMRALMEGEFKTADTLAQNYIEIGRRVKSEDAENCWAAQTCLARFERGAGEAILVLLRSHVRNHPRLLAFRAAPAWVSAELGYTEEAWHDLGEFFDEGFLNIPRDMNWLGMMTMLAMTSAELRDRESAKLLLHLLSPYSARYAVLGYGAVFLGSVASQLARLTSVVDGWAAARPLFAQARHLNLRVRALPWVTRSEHDQAVELIFHGQSQEAQALLVTAARRAGQLGMGHLLARIEEKLERSSA